MSTEQCRGVRIADTGYRMAEIVWLRAGALRTHHARVDIYYEPAAAIYRLLLVTCLINTRYALTRKPERSGQHARTAHAAGRPGPRSPIRIVLPIAYLQIVLVDRYVGGRGRQPARYPPRASHQRGRRPRVGARSRVEIGYESTPNPKGKAKRVKTTHPVPPDDTCSARRLACHRRTVTQPTWTRDGQRRVPERARRLRSCVSGTHAYNTSCPHVPVLMSS